MVRELHPAAAGSTAVAGSTADAALTARARLTTHTSRTSRTSLTTPELEDFVVDLTNSIDRWHHLVRHTDDVRVYEQIWDDPLVNAWLICWSEDQDTGYHDHDESTAAIAVISGQVREDRLRLGSPPTSQVVRAGSVFTVPSVAIHRVLHSGTQPAVTIHAYSPPLVRSGAYRTGSHGELEREVLPIEEELRPIAVAAA